MNNITVPFNPIFKPVHQCKKRYVVMKGSAGSGKSVDTAQLYILRLMRDKGRNLVCVRKSDITNRDSTFDPIGPPESRSILSKMSSILYSVLIIYA